MFSHRVTPPPPDSCLCLHPSGPACGGDGGSEPRRPASWTAIRLTRSSSRLGNSSSMDALRSGLRPDPGGRDAQGRNTSTWPCPAHRPESNTGTSTPYHLSGRPRASCPRPRCARRPRVEAAARPTAVQRFHGRLRSLEQRLARQPHAAPAAGAARINAKVVPSAGRQAHLLRAQVADADGTSADDFVSVTATVKHVGQKVVIYLDDAAPTRAGIPDRHRPDRQPLRRPAVPHRHHRLRPRVRYGRQRPGASCS